jgi:hypothetical protein
LVEQTYLKYQLNLFAVKVVIPEIVNNAKLVKVPTNNIWLGCCISGTNSKLSAVKVVMPDHAPDKDKLVKST